MADMRISKWSAVSLLATALGPLIAFPASAQSDAPPTAEQSWQACIGPASAPGPRVSACSAVIEARTETGRKLAAAYCNRGHGRTEQRDLEAALADLDEAIRIDPAYACGYSNRGRVFALKREFDRAVTDYDTAIRIDPQFALAYNNRGDAFFSKGDINGAMADFNMAIKLDPTLAIAYGNRGFAYYRMRDMAHAIANFSMQIKLAPDVLAYLNRGNAFAIPNSSTARLRIMAR
jgi:tetratricopeptide (TPR) repeat protein